MNDVVKHDPNEERSEVGQPMPDFSGDRGDYMVLRAEIVQKCEDLNGGKSNPKAHPGSLAVLARLEHSIRATALYAAPDARTADKAFMVGMQEFLRL
jgi:hypothetical protein